MGTEAENLNWTMCRDTGRFSPKRDIFIKLLPSGLRKTLRAGGGGWHQVNCVFQTQQDWHIHELIETVVVCLQPTQVQTRWGPCTKMGRQIWPSIPKGKNSVSRGVSGIHTTLKGGPHGQGKVVNQKQTPRYTLLCLDFCFPYRSFACMLWVLILCVSLCVCFSCSFFVSFSFFVCSFSFILFKEICLFY